MKTVSPVSLLSLFYRKNDNQKNDNLYYSVTKILKIFETPKSKSLFLAINLIIRILFVSLPQEHKTIMRMNIGDKAPEILGKDEQGRDIRLSDYRGRKLVLYFYPKDNTSGCTAEACSLRDHYNELQGAGYEVVGVSKDSAASHVKFKEKHELPFPLIADVDKELLQAMGAWGEKVMYGKKTEGTIRTTFIINEEGIIEQIFAGKQVKTKEHAEQILSR